MEFFFISLNMHGHTSESMKIAISFILISIFQQTTVFTYNPTEKTQNVDYIPSSKELLFRGRNNLTFTSVEGEVLREVLLTTDRIKNLNTLEVITIGNALYLINKSGGIVYKLEITVNIVRRTI